MKKVFLLIIVLVSLIGLSLASNRDRLDFYGTYTFEKVSYLLPLSSNTIDYVNERMAGTEYTIEADLFRIESADKIVEISSPDYVKEEIPKGLSTLYDVHTLDGNKIEYQYTIFKKDGSKTHWRLYISSDNVWIASYADNTANGSEIIMYIYKLAISTDSGTMKSQDIDSLIPEGWHILERFGKQEKAEGDLNKD